MNKLDYLDHRLLKYAQVSLTGIIVKITGKMLCDGQLTPAVSVKVTDIRGVLNQAVYNWGWRTRIPQKNQILGMVPLYRKTGSDHFDSPKEPEIGDTAIIGFMDYAKLDKPIVVFCGRPEN